MKKQLITLAMVLTLAMPVNVMAEQTTYTEGALYYVIVDNSITITGYFGHDSVVDVPSSIAGIPVNTIKTGAFSNNSYVKEVELPDTITTIEENAFAANTNVSFQNNKSNDPPSGNSKEPSGNQGNPTGGVNKTPSTVKPNSGTSTQETTVKPADNADVQSGSVNEANFDEADVFLDDESEELDVTDENEVVLDEDDFVEKSHHGLTYLIVAVVVVVLAGIIGTIAIKKKKQKKI